MHSSPLIKRAAGERYHPESFKQRWEIVKKLGEYVILLLCRPLSYFLAKRGGFSKVTIGKRRSEEDSVYSGFGPKGTSVEQGENEVAIKCISKEDMKNGSESEELVAREIQTFVTVRFPLYSNTRLLSSDPRLEMVFHTSHNFMKFVRMKSLFI